jgi:hypothetical protein
MEWNNLTYESRNYIHDRFMEYNIPGHEAYSDEMIFPNEIKELDSEEIIQFLQIKDISHVLPVSQFPELKSDINNIVLEDSFTNRSRGAEIISENEIEIIQKDNLNDIEDFENNLEILENLPEILIGSTAIGLGLTSFQAYTKIRKNEIQLNEAPRYIIVKSGGKIIRVAIIGVCLNSGSVVLVSAIGAYYIYKSRNFLINALNITWKVLTHPISMKLYYATGVITINIIGGSLKVLNSSGKLIWNIATHDTTKNVVVGAAHLSGKLIENTVKTTYNVATHETTKTIAIETVKVSAKIVSGTVKGVYDVATHETTKSIVSETAQVTGKVLIGTAQVTGTVISGTVKGLWSFTKLFLKSK